MAKKKKSPMPTKAKAKKASTAKKPVKAESAGKKAAPKKKVKDVKDARKETGVASRGARTTTVKRTAQKPPRPQRMPAPPERSMGGSMPGTETAHAQTEAPPQATTPERERSRKRGFAQQAHRTAKPNEQQPGQTAEHGNSNDRPGSQLERERHLYPNGNKPNSGSARSTQYKGKRRDNMSQGGE